MGYFTLEYGMYGYFKDQWRAAMLLPEYRAIESEKEKEEMAAAGDAQPTFEEGEGTEGSAADAEADDA